MIPHDTDPATPCASEYHRPMKKATPFPLHKLLIRSFDGALGQRASRKLERQLADSEQLRAEQERIARLREDLRAYGERLDFGPFFSARVLHRLGQAGVAAIETRSALEIAFRYVTMPAFAAVLLLAIFFLQNGQAVNWDAVGGLDGLTVADLMTDFYLMGDAYVNAP
ncbi:MAG: hypothetical protein OHK0039_43660 [Bacteroidia bacterium]